MMIEQNETLMKDLDVVRKAALSMKTVPDDPENTTSTVLMEEAETPSSKPKASTRQSSAPASASLVGGAGAAATASRIPAKTPTKAPARLSTKTPTKAPTAPAKTPVRATALPTKKESQAAKADKPGAHVQAEAPAAAAAEGAKEAPKKKGSLFKTAPKEPKAPRIDFAAEARRKQEVLEQERKLADQFKDACELANDEAMRKEAAERAARLMQNPWEAAPKGSAPTVMTKASPVLTATLAVDTLEVDTPAGVAGADGAAETGAPAAGEAPQYGEAQAQTLPPAPLSPAAEARSAGASADGDAEEDEDKLFAVLEAKVELEQTIAVTKAQMEAEAQAAVEERRRLEEQLAAMRKAQQAPPPEPVSTAPAPAPTDQAFWQAVDAWSVDQVCEWAAANKLDAGLCVTAPPRSLPAFALPQHAARWAWRGAGRGARCEPAARARPGQLATGAQRRLCFVFLCTAPSGSARTRLTVAFCLSWTTTFSKRISACRPN